MCQQLNISPSDKELLPRLIPITWEIEHFTLPFNPDGVITRLEDGSLLLYSTSNIPWLFVLFYSISTFCS